MNIAFYGSSLLSSYWNGAATYYRGLLQALVAYGHEITFYDPVPPDNACTGRVHCRSARNPLRRMRDTP